MQLLQQFVLPEMRVYFASLLFICLLYTLLLLLFYLT